MVADVAALDHARAKQDRARDLVALAAVRNIDLEDLDEQAVELERRAGEPRLCLELRVLTRAAPTVMKPVTSSCPSWTR